jgi:predicted O-linked N-acetylglucosamine transferase (SPINDLY family)
MLTQHTPIQSSAALIEQAATALDSRHYLQATELYERLAEAEPEQVSHYWHLGLARLLAGEETEAQLTWMMVMEEGDAGQVDGWTKDLVAVLETQLSTLNLDETDSSKKSHDLKLAWTIRQYIRELLPDDISNLLHLVQLTIQLGLFEGKNLEDWGLTSRLRTESHDFLDVDWLLQVMVQVLEEWFEDPLTLEFTEVCLGWVKDSEALIGLLLPKAAKLFDSGTIRDTALSELFLEYCLRYDSQHLEVLRYLSGCYYRDGRLLESIALSKRYRDVCKTIPDQLIGITLVMNRMLRTGSQWQEAHELQQQQQALLQKFIQEYVPSEQPIEPHVLCSSFFATAYFDDIPAQTRPQQNQIAQLCQSDMYFHAKPSIDLFQQRNSAPRTKKDKIKISYVSNCFKKHSVGWLARWLFKHHDHNRFEICTYHIRQNHLDEFADHWFVQNADESAQLHGGSLVMAEYISEHGQDILIDLDSITHDGTCGIMALKPAPIQVSWLGFDAPGLPTVDYFIADPYVLPENAQDYYSEKIWRLPSTYVAVDGFEIGVPTLRREHLDIPGDAVIYLTSQQGHKLNPDIVRSQLQILKEVPDSYFLIKGRVEESLLQKAFEEIAETEGVPLDRLRFLPDAPSEYIHRANLQIADVVLDTYPYNGATTTLETLWMGIPIVTRVGQQFSARNTYAFMTNAGITEGIAWTQEEYIEWGVRLGKDATLREQIQRKLRQSRHTSPLWNGKQFAREMEQAYEAMFQIYLDQQ